MARSRRKRPVTPEDLNRFVFVGSPRMSPDGSQILFAHKTIGEKNTYKTNLWRVPATGGDPAPFTAGDRDGLPRWSPDGSRVAFVRSPKEGGAQVHVISAGGGEAHALTKFPEGSIAEVRWSPKGDRLAVQFRETDPDWTQDTAKERKEKGLSDPPRVLDSAFYRFDGDGYFNAQRYHLYLVDAETGEHRKVYDKDTLGFFSFDWSPDGKQIAIATNRDKHAMERPWKDEIVLLDAKTGKATPVPLMPPGPKTAVKFSPDGKKLAYAGRIGEDDVYSPENLELFVADVRQGKPLSVTADEDFCLMAVALTDTSEASFGPNFQWTPDSKRILVSIGWHGEAHVAAVDAKGGPLRFLTTGAYDHGMGTLSADGKRLAMTRATTTELGEVFVGEVKAKEVRTTGLTTFNQEWLKEVELAATKMHWVKAEDGHPVQLWYLRPPGKSAKARVPAVLEVHGGPHAQYGVGFFHEFQVLAAAGYAVFFSNPRGSKGYGRDHTAAIRGHWGSADWVDVQAVTRYMQERPWVDEKRIAIMGGSYGGYITNWAIGHSQDYKAAITDRCVSNLISMSGNSDFIQVPDSYWRGNFWDETEDLWRDSPIHHMGDVSTPTLIIHSEGDLRCNIEQAEQVHALLTLKRVPTRFVRYPRSTSHGMSRGGPPDMRLHRLHQILDWYKEYL